MREWLVIHPCGTEQVWINGEPSSKVMQSFELTWLIRLYSFGQNSWTLLPAWWDMTCGLPREAWDLGQRWFSILREPFKGLTAHLATGQQILPWSGHLEVMHHHFEYTCGYSHRNYSFTWLKRAESTNRYPTHRRAIQKSSLWPR